MQGRLHVREVLDNNGNLVSILHSTFYQSCDDAWRRMIIVIVCGSSSSLLLDVTLSWLHFKIVLTNSFHSPNTPSFWEPDDGYGCKQLFRDTFLIEGFHVCLFVWWHGRWLVASVLVCDG
ncbi:hypothetical protein L1987_21035 [Smallanthus sonchifolius]|uniref:Uncharacterized protein n=1 Tax=Smallanthus sonchifolius TaxID=185202 RepID=A0ACB9ISR5_9ASTR|nr:hypothetical protein L1987_21035 [Smallanthus sonchifolius]